MISITSHDNLGAKALYLALALFSVIGNMIWRIMYALVIVPKTIFAGMNVLGGMCEDSEEWKTRNNVNTDL